MAIIFNHSTPLTWLLSFLFQRSGLSTCTFFFKNNFYTRLARIANKSVLTRKGYDHFVSVKYYKLEVSI